MDIDKLVYEINYSKETICKIINMQCRKTLYNLGEILSKNLISLDELYESLYSIYGNTIIFSRRSLLYSKCFYEKYLKVMNLIPINMTWNQCVILLEKHYSLDEDINIFKTINFFSLNEKEINYFLNNNSICFFDDKSVNNIVMEFINLKEREE